MNKLLLLLALSAPVSLLAQKGKPATYAKTITADDMRKHLYIIAGPEMEGRNTPSPGLEKAADYIENHFKSIGLLPGNNGSYRQRYPLYKDSVISSAVAINGTDYTIYQDYLPSTQFNHTAQLRFSEVVFVGYGIVDGALDAYKDVDVAGKAVLILDGAPEGFKPTSNGFNSSVSIFNKAAKAQQKGAVAVINIASNFPRKPIPSSPRYTMNGFPASVLPQTFTISESLAAKIAGADAAKFKEWAKSSTVQSKTYKADIALSYAKGTETASASNVLGLLEGTDKKDEYVIITAHYDHVGKRDDGTIYYGADDDGSGTTGILELAEAFAKAKAAGKGPRRSILFMTVSGEEKGLWGSAYYANHPVFPLDKTTVDLNIDMIGRTGSDFIGHKDSINYVYIIGDDKLSTDLTPITDAANKSTKLILDRRYNDPNDKNRFYYRSDHYNFAEKGVPVIFYFDGVHADYHKPTDTPDKINYPLMARRAQLVFFTAWEMANRDAMLKRDIKLEKPKGF